MTSVFGSLITIFDNLKLGGQNKPSYTSETAATALYNGFDSENTDTMGQLEYCHNAASGVVYKIDKSKVYTKLTAQTQFSDGSVLADRTLAFVPDANTSYWALGELITVTSSKKIQFTNDSLEHYVAFESDGELHVQTSTTDAITKHVLVAVITNNAIANEPVWFADERHGIKQSGESHLIIHATRGFANVYGLDVQGLVDNGTTFTKITAGLSYDEDIPMAFAETTAIPSLYREGVGGAWRLTPTTSNKLAHFVLTKAVYNRYNAGTDTWDLYEIDSNYIATTFLATNNVLAPIVRLVSQSADASRTIARAKAPANWYRIKKTGLPSSEAHAICSIVVHMENTGQIELGTDNEIYSDCRAGFPIQMYL